MIELVFITGNPEKLKQAQLELKGFPIKLLPMKIDAPEIQDTRLEIVAGYSARCAADKLGKPVVKTDAGYYIEALNGFPGPFIKFVNQWLTPQDILKMMENKKNRKVRAPICLAYCEPDKEPKIFISENFGTIAYKAEGKNGSTIDQIYIPVGYAHPLATLPPGERLKVWNANCWHQLAKFLIYGEGKKRRNRA